MNNFKPSVWVERAVLLQWGFTSVGMCCCVNRSHPKTLEYFKSLFYCMQSFSMSFQIMFQSETVTTMTVERFLCAVYSLTCPFKLTCPLNVIPQNNTPFSPHCIIICHTKYPLSVKGFWHVAHVYRIWPVWIINSGTADRWFKRLMGWGLGPLNSKYPSFTKCNLNPIKLSPI